MATLLETCQQIALRIGLPKPTVVLSSDGALVPQYFVLLCEAAKDLIRRHDWQCLEQEVTLSSVAGELQLPNLRVAYPDFQRLSEDTIINVTRGLRMKPLSRQQHTTIKLNPSVVTQGAFYRIRGDQFLMPGNTAVGDQVVFEYISKHWATTPGDAHERVAIPSSDDDIILLDDEALILSVKWRFKKENGLEYGEDFNDFEKYVQEIKGSDTPHETLSLTPNTSIGFLNVTNTFTIPG